MNTFELIRTVDRRTNREDRRKCDDRRRRRGESERDPMVQTLQELLHEAHARIRSLENAVEALKKAI